MRKVQRFFTVALLAAGLAGCGVPRASLDLVQAEITRQARVDAQDPAAVRAELRAQSAKWESLGKLLRQREFGGVGFVDPRFIDLVDRTAAIARRQSALMDQHVDDPARNAALLREFQQLWEQSARYLGR